MFESNPSHSDNPLAYRYIRTDLATKTLPNSEAILAKLQDGGWYVQEDIRGLQMQIHVDLPNGCFACFGMLGRPLGIFIDKAFEDELFRTLGSPKGVQTFNGVLKHGMIYIYDCLKSEGHSLSTVNFSERFQTIPKLFISPKIRVVRTYFGPRMRSQYHKLKEGTWLARPGKRPGFIGQNLKLQSPSDQIN